ncbi:MAG: amino acid permease [Pyrinomonadaceae bacterium MAG19_C2-C3]|nr:amino acid permease [Pyrinomonadaceae bacterium MAG19_C2-C3]
MSSTTSAQTSLIRGLGLAAAFSIVVGNVIGQGIFLKTRVMTCNVGEPSTVLFVWIAAGLLSLAGALTYAELAAMMPKAGGEYVFVREAYGRCTGFLYGWMQFFIAKTGSQAALAVGFAIFLNLLLGGALDGEYFRFQISTFTFTFGAMQVVALSAIVLVTLINCLAVSLSGNVAAVLTAVKIALVLLIVIGAFVFADGTFAHFASSGAGGVCEGVDAAARTGFAGFGAAMLGALWAYDGWNNLTLVAGEVKQPQRNIPIALISGMATVGCLYVLANVAYFYVLTPDEIASIPAASSVASQVAERFLGATAVGFMAAALLASTFGTLHTSILTGARVPYAMSRDGLFFQSLARLSQRARVPVGALILQGVWASVLALSGSYDALTDYVIFASWIFYGLATASVFIFRTRLPDAERPYKTWGYPVVPVLFLLVTAALLINTLLTTPRQALTGLALIALGLPVYWYWTRANKAA